MTGCDPTFISFLKFSPNLVSLGRVLGGGLGEMSEVRSEVSQKVMAARAPRSMNIIASATLV